MRAMTVALGFGLLAGGALAADVSGGGSLRVLNGAPWTSAPTSAEMAGAFPRSAIGKVSEGRVMLRCDFTSGGGLIDCDTVSEAPQGLGFGRAAHNLVRDFRLAVDPTLAAMDANGDVRIDVPFDFRDPSHAAPAEVGDPLWLKGLSVDAVYRFYPSDAAKAGVKEGRATVDCTVTHAGALTGCAVASETPGGLGFGQAALGVAGQMVMNPWTASGAPVDGARVALPIRFEAP
jgi:TonB family protein